MTLSRSKCLTCALSVILVGSPVACSTQSGEAHGRSEGTHVQGSGRVDPNSDSAGDSSRGLDDFGVKVHSYRIKETYPHERSSYTQGLVIHEGKMYESTGRQGESTLREVDWKTGKATRRHNLAPDLFGEGLCVWKGLLVQLTWKSGQAIVYDRRNLQELYRLEYAGEGWGLTSDGKSLIMSDGTDTLRFLSPADFSLERKLRVTRGGVRLWDINELEYIEGELWANVYQRELIVRIDPETGAVRSVIDLRGLQRKQGVKDPRQDVLNGIAYDSRTRRIFITGKYWPNLYEIEVLD